MKLVSVHPRDMRCLLSEVSCFHNAGRRRAWVMNIAGPFCLWPKPARPGSSVNVMAEQIANSVSMYTGLNVRVNVNAGAVDLLVIIDDATRLRYIRQEYRKAVHA